jgi:hypothetical protein
MLFLDGYSVNEQNNSSFSPLLNGICLNDKKPSVEEFPLYNHVDIKDIQQHNFKVRTAAYRAIKRPGRSECRTCFLPIYGILTFFFYL